MNKQVFQPSVLSTLARAVIPLLFTIVITIIVFFGLRQANESSHTEGTRLLEEALRRAAIHNYAIEGRFPESLEYMAEKYGIYIDTTRFVVHFDVFATNIFPDIRVIDLNR